MVTDADLAEATALQRETGASVDAAFVRMGAVSEEQLLAALSTQLDIPLLAPDALPAEVDVATALTRLDIPVQWLIDREAVLWFTMGSDGEEHLNVAGRRVFEPALQEAAEQFHQNPARFYLVSGSLIEPLLSALGHHAAVEQDTQALDPTRLRELAQEAPVIDFVNAIFTQALTQRASDVHFEPFENNIVVRFRVDGVLRQWRTAPRSMFDAISSRIKLLSGMDIAERRLPQDGRQSIRVSGRDLDVRVSTLPTTWGESLVVRLLGNTKFIPELLELGLDENESAVLLETIRKPNGLVLVTGPTGSGKTTTVYRLIAHLNDGVRKILTIEDPVEIDVPGALQMKVRTEIGLDFAAGLRSILRQDPDVIFVGEIRDSETAKTAVQAALTGHLVISTVHTNSALAAVARLLDLGVEDFLLADVLRALVGQRLVRRICQSCATPAPNADELEHRAHTLAPKLSESGTAKWRVGGGCPACGGSGFQGRVGVYEIATVSAAMQDAVRARAPESELAALARPLGYRTLLEAAILKARAGETTLAEALRVASAPA
ncbi:MAG: ATPase, T2SS/T4P/T4SS family [Terricaulis sp.]